jgi:TatD DNase family protein
LFIDSHAHLEMEQFDTDRTAVLERARAAGIDNILAIGSGTGPGSLDCAIRLADQHDWIYATIGIHPHEAKLAGEQDFEELANLAKRSKVLAWGEIGLDYYYDHSPREVQREVFVRQMQMARAANLPIVIHCRPSENSENAWDECLGLIEENWSASRLGGILHCFTGQEPHALKAVELGFLVSFSGNITFPRAENIRQVAKKLSLDRILIETDSPFLAPVPHRGKRNEPAFVVKVAEKIAELRGISVDQVARQTTENFHQFFKGFSGGKNPVHAEH